MSYHGYTIYDPDEDVWEPIWDFPGYYISATGHVWGPGRYGKDGLLKPTRIGVCGHLDVCLWKDHKRYHRYVHRLVAEAFIPNPEHYPIARHLDDDPTNNDVDNLAWGTAVDNAHDCINNGNFYYLTPEDIKKANEARYTPIDLVDLVTGERIFFDNETECARYLHIKRSEISESLLYDKIIKHRYIVVYPNEEAEISINRFRSAKKVPIEAVNLETGEILRFNGQTEAANYLCMSVASISNCLNKKQNNAKGWRFYYIESEDIIDD